MHPNTLGQPRVDAFVANAHSAGTTHHGFIDSMLHGFAWRLGSDSANAIFHLAPRLFILVVLVGAIFVGARWLRRRHRL